jgi:nitroreductase
LDLYRTPRDATPPPRKTRGEEPEFPKDRDPGAAAMLEALARRRTSHGAVSPLPVRKEHKQLLMEAAAMAPSYLNSQPWRFVLIEDRDTIEEIADLEGAAYRGVVGGGSWLRRYGRWMHSSRAEAERSGDGVVVELPRSLRPLERIVSDRATTPLGTAAMRLLGIPRRLAEQNRALVAGSPLLVAVLVDRSGMPDDEKLWTYSVFGASASIQNVWLAASSVGLGMNFVNAISEDAQAWEKVESLLRVPRRWELLFLFRAGYLPGADGKLDFGWQTRHRKPIQSYVFLENCERPADADFDALGGQR